MAARRAGRGQQQLFDKHGHPTWRDGKRVRQRRRRRPGRKPKGRRAGSPHKTRPELKACQPVHVVLRVVEDIGSLRKRYMYKALRDATLAVARRELFDLRGRAFRIVHISIQGNHVHLLVEADNKMALARGMQSFQISAAKHLNRAVSIRSVRFASREERQQAMATRRRGTVFPDRYHQEIITSPRQARRALAYVLNNWRKHREDRGELSSTWKIDPFATGLYFDGWKERENEVTVMKFRDTYEPLLVYVPKTWLLREGWRKHGLIGFHEVPGASRTRATA